MKRGVLFLILFAIALVFATCLFADQNTQGKSGKTLFEKHCAVCHPDGGNRLNPLQTLREKDLKANGFTTPRDIVRKMRKPEAFSPHAGKWSAMKTFNEKTIPDDEALRIAEYIFKTFK